MFQLRDMLRNFIGETVDTGFVANVNVVKNLNAKRWYLN